MRFRLGLLLGFAIGYIFGAKAGTKRYVQLQKLWSSVSRSEPAQQISAEVRLAADRAGEVIEQKAAEGVEKVTGLVRGSSSSKTGNGSITPNVTPA